MNTDQTFKISDPGSSAFIRDPSSSKIDPQIPRPIPKELDRFRCLSWFYCYNNTVEVSPQYWSIEPGYACPVYTGQAVCVPQRIYGLVTPVRQNIYRFRFLCRTAKEDAERKKYTQGKSRRQFDHHPGGKLRNTSKT